MFQFEQTNDPGRICQSEAVSKIFDLNHCFGEDFFLEEGFLKGSLFLVFLLESLKPCIDHP